MSILHVLGVKKLLENLGEVSEKVIKGTRKGVIKAALDIEAAAKSNAPVDLGNLKASGYTVGPEDMTGALASGFTGENSGKIVKARDSSVAASKKRVKKSIMPTAMVGFGANYAIYVHELHATKGKFLERAVRENRRNTLKVIGDEIEKAL